MGEGILPPPLLVATWAGAAAAVGVGVRRMAAESVPKVAVLAAAFFVASLIRVPVGPASAHLVLNGVMGVLLRWQVFPALAAALLLQAVFFGFGGITSLGANVLIMGAGALAARAVFVVGRQPGEGTRVTAVRGALAGAVGIVVGTLLLIALLVAAGREFLPAAGVVAVAQLPVAAVEAVVAAAGLSFLVRLRPEMLPHAAGGPGA